MLVVWMLAPLNNTACSEMTIPIHKHTNWQVLIFANAPDEGMRLRLFLEAFGLRLALLSPDQPLNSRWGAHSAPGRPAAPRPDQVHSVQDTRYKKLSR